MASTTVYGNFWARTVSGTAVVQVRAGNYSDALTFTETPRLVTFTGPSNGDPFFYIWLRGAESPACSNTADLLIWHPDLRRPIDTVGMPSYQRVTSSSNYDTTGFFPYLRFDGADDSLYSAANINFSTSNEMTVFAGVAKLSDPAGGCIAEFGSDLFAGSGIFILDGPISTDEYFWRSKGTGTSDVAINSATYAAPVLSALTALGKISTDVSILRINAAQVGSSSSDQGSGNYANDTLNVGRRYNSYNAFNGRIYSLIVRGALTSGTTLTSTERWISQRMPGNLIA
jgi:hypothetical protein